jgi:hypothetical protein
MKRNFGVYTTFLMIAIAALPCPNSLAEIVDQKTEIAAVQGQEIDFISIAKDAYIYGYPLVTMEMTKRVMTNVSKASEKLAPVGQFVNMRTYPTAADKIVTAPNADTLYSSAWLDLAKEPYVFSTPAPKGRYYLMPMLNGWTEVFADPGARTKDLKAESYAITGPGWKGQLPEGLIEYKSSTNMVWILGRTYCTGTERDYTKAHTFQNELSLIPLSAYGKPYAAPLATVDASVDMKTPVRDQVNNMDVLSYFKLLAKLMKDNPPMDEDAQIISEMAKIPGQDFDPSRLDSITSNNFQNIPKIAQAIIMEHGKNSGINSNGWKYSLQTGNYGTDYLQRAYITAFGLGANKPLDAVYPVSEVDANGKPYSGEHKYVIHFDVAHTPPVNGFWSITMYDDKFFFVPNPLNRFTVSSRFNFKYTKDGALDIYIQKDSPGKELESNWLPAPEGKFILMLRMYWPTAEALEGKYIIPPVKETP